MRVGKLTSRENAILTVKEVLLFWEKARIPTQYETRCVDKIIKIWNTWKSIKKTPRATGALKNKIDQFIDSLHDLFDFAHEDALQHMKNQEDKDFLEIQRQKGRPGSMVGVDKNLALQEQRTQERKRQEQNRKRNCNELMQERGTNFLFRFRYSYLYYYIQSDIHGSLIFFS